MDCVTQAMHTIKVTYSLAHNSPRIHRSSTSSLILTALLPPPTPSLCSFPMRSGGSGSSEGGPLSGLALSHWLVVPPERHATCARICFLSQLVAVGCSSGEVALCRLVRSAGASALAAAGGAAAGMGAGGAAVAEEPVSALACLVQERDEGEVKVV